MVRVVDEQIKGTSTRKEKFTTSFNTIFYDTTAKTIIITNKLELQINVPVY